MPLYEYHCPVCETSYEKVVPITQADNPQTCPTCGAEDNHRLISRVAAFSGSTSGTSSSSSSCSTGGRFT